MQMLKDHEAGLDDTVRKSSQNLNLGGNELKKKVLLLKSFVEEVVKLPNAFVYLPESFCC